MSRNVTSDNGAGAATVTRSGRAVKLTEKVVENQATAKCDKLKTSHPTSEPQSTVGAKENAKQDETVQSVVSGLSWLTKQTSSKRSEKRRDELVRAHELSIKLQYVEREEGLQKQLEDISRQKCKLEIERQRQETLARAKAYDDDDPDRPLPSDNIGIPVQDRVHDHRQRSSAALL